MPLRKAKTKYGVVIGTEGPFSTTTEFRSVPFARPPIGELRLHKPVEPEPWKGEKVCDRWPDAPIGELRPSGRVLPESEDCLYMNIFTPAETAEDNLPVMVWFYGGGFRSGSVCNSYNGATKSGEGWTYTGEFLNQKGVILVTPNYRVGLLGFCCHEKLIERDKTAGNYGLWDQIAALRFVRENIREFGGNPENITIFGHSAGGVSVRMLIASRQTKGLFKRAIIQSGSGLMEAERFRSPRWIAEWTEKAMECLGLSFHDLMTGDALELTDRISGKVYELYTGLENPQFPLKPGIFVPCLDGEALDQVPGVALYAGDYDQDIDILIGTVLLDDYQPIKACFPEVEGDGELMRAVAYGPAVSLGRRMAETGRKPIYGYFWEHHVPGPGRSGPYHGCEFPYLFGKMDFYARNWTDYDYQLEQAVMAYWTNFAKDGNPNGQGLPRWPEFTRETPLVMNFRDDGFDAKDVVDSEAGERLMQFFTRHPGHVETLKHYILTW